MALSWTRRLTSPAAKWIAAVAAIGAVTAPLTLRALHHEHRLQIATAQVTDGPIVRRSTATGTLQAVATVQVGAQVSGTIQSLRVDYNAIVHRGEVLATLDPALLQTSLDQANAALAEAHASEAQAAATRDAAQTAVVDAQTKLTRAEQLAARSIIAAADLDSARIAFASARADLQSSESQLEIARASARQAQAAVDQAAINVQRTVITAPID